MKACDWEKRLLNFLYGNNNVNLLKINKGISWLKQYHDGQYRKSGEPFYTHPLEVTYMVAHYLPCTHTIIASLLHDIVEDTEVTIEMVKNEFGIKVANIVDRLTRDRYDGSKWSIEYLLDKAYTEQDREAQLIKLMDRLHNMLTVNAKPIHKRIKTAKETINMFIILSAYLEIPNVEIKLTELCKEILNPRDTNRLKSDSISASEDLLSLIVQNDLEQKRKL